jgi:phage tail protein X
MNYTCKAGETVDEVCNRFYGSTYAGQVEIVLEANRALDLGQYITLPAGLTITLPDFAAKPQESVRLFT